MEPIAVGYLAAIVDGEGSFTAQPIRKRQINTAVTVANTDIRILDYCKQITGVGTVIEHSRGRGAKAHHRTQYIWSVAAKGEVAAVCRIIIPALKGKAAQATVLLELCERRMAGGPLQDHDFDLVARLRDLNQRRAV